MLRLLAYLPRVLRGYKYVYTMLTTRANASGPGNQATAVFLIPEFSKV